MIRTLLKFIVAAPFIVLCAAITLINVRLSTSKNESPSVVQLYKELKSLNAQIDKGADLSMQQLYPEGYVFLNALYGLAWCNLAAQSTDGKGHYREALTQIQSAWGRIDSPLGRATFTRELNPEYGSFYLGWSNILLAKKLLIELPEERNPREITIFASTCDSIAKALSNYTYPVSYYGAAWPADVVVCVASLAAYDDLFSNTKYDSLIMDWLSRVRERCDDQGMIPHMAIPASGNAAGSARGSSQCLMLIMLREIDPDFAKQQFGLFKKNFVATRFGLSGIREFPIGDWNFGDVDSGPVILGFGAAATIVGAPTLSIFGDHANASRISKFIEASGFPVETAENRYYLLGTLPIADAFIAWGHSLTLGAPREAVSFLRFHIYSALVLLPLLLFIWLLVKPEKPDSTRNLTIGW